MQHFRIYSAHIFCMLPRVSSCAVKIVFPLIFLIQFLQGVFVKRALECGFSATRLTRNSKSFKPFGGGCTGLKCQGWMCTNRFRSAVHVFTVDPFYPREVIDVPTFAGRDDTRDHKILSALRTLHELNHIWITIESFLSC